MTEMLMISGDRIGITDDDAARITQRVTMGGVVEGSMPLENGDLVVLQNICMLVHNTEEAGETETEAIKRIFNKHVTRITKTELCEKLGVEVGDQTKSELVTEVVNRF